MTAQELQQLYGIKYAVAAKWVGPLSEALRLAECNTPQRVACFLAQIGHESGNLRYVREIWGPTKQQLRYEPVTTLSKRLGNTSPGDGKRYMGRGLIQTTGFSNYSELKRLFKRLFNITSPDFTVSPADLEQTRYAALSAAIFWKTRNLNRFADSGNFAELTRRINGGYNGLAHRQALYTKAIALCLS